MTGSPIAVPRTGKPALKTPTTTLLPKLKAGQAFSFSPPWTACAERRRRQGPAAATRSGSARALTPTPTSTRPARTRKPRRTNQNNTAVGLDRPLSFRNDLQVCKSELSMGCADHDAVGFRRCLLVFRSDQPPRAASEYAGHGLTSTGPPSW